MNKKISRKKFIKDVSIFTFGMFAFSNMLLAAEKGLSKVLNIIPIQNDPKGILNLLKGFKYKIIFIVQLDCQLTINFSYFSRMVI